MEKIAIVYVSFHHHNTKKIVDVVAEELDADVFDLKEAKKQDFSRYHRIGFASGIYFERVHKSLYRFIEEAEDLPREAFMLLTSGTGSKKHVDQFAKRLTSKGFHVRDAFQCKGHDTYAIWKIFGGIAKGHPNTKDLEKARRFAREMKEKNL